MRKLLRQIALHRAHVSSGLRLISHALMMRAEKHDLSKYRDDEAKWYEQLNAELSGVAYGSADYIAAVGRARPGVDLHFSRNRHHPEYHTAARGLTTMTWLDVIEMVVDWRSAHLAHGGEKDDPLWYDRNLIEKGAMLTREQLWLAEQVARFLVRGGDD